MWITELEGRSLTIGITATCGVAFMLLGFDQGVFGGILGNTQFNSTFKDPDPTVQGQIVSTYDIGCILGALLSIFVGDRLGRKKAIILACLLVIVGGTLEASSFSLPQMIIARLIAGLGIGMDTVVIPMWQSETSRPQHRGKLVAFQLVLVVGGLDLTEWINVGMAYISNKPVSWRFPLAFQCFFAVLAMLMVVCMPESPRWLCLKERNDEAQVVIARFMGKPVDSDEVVESLQLLVRTVAYEKEVENVGWREVFSNREQQTFRRICLGAGVSLFQQMGGINVVVYYLPVVLEQSLGFSHEMALILTAVDFISLMIWGGVVMLAIDKWGRRKLMLLGAFGTGFSFTVAVIGLALKTYVSYAFAVTGIFVYNVFFGLSFLSITFSYPSEINSQRHRNLGASVAMMTQYIFAYIIALITPIGIANIGWKYYIIFAVLNFVWVPIIYYFYIETAGLSLEEIDKLFEIHYKGGKGMTWKEATRLAKEHIALTKIQIHDKTQLAHSAEVDHVEVGEKGSSI